MVEAFSENVLKHSPIFNETYVNEYWGGIENFLTNGFGFKVLSERRTVSECAAIFRSQRFAEIGIAAHSAFRGRGYAMLYALCFYFVLP
ncbi:GNAT family N-acetyltransferase [Bacillus sonorensis]|uniref:GNAT family N-acetyltransferase n=1 Tax=Bacillus sonorensis TaxID=119858 RepID=UPI0004963763|nr:GNAT family N-acetyltransferase [Bacillus sonorensis]MEC1438880.1 GNAT family N-acetyltransferase [Bacillus sonorensis]MEC1502901.1 GNAT family N-acetyltransferase [Bacillus sonorensis]MEC1536700.1 GNAT family N-acetyltransferase [Bacillus sonorensis]MEC1588433.1 GNAT family N-acetyltransferase [Bacillus sonorensis]